MTLQRGRSGRQSFVSRGRGKRPQGIGKEQPQTAIRKSARLEGIERFQRRAVSKTKSSPRHPIPSPSTSNTHSKEVFQDPPVRPGPEAVAQLHSPGREEADRKLDRKLDRKRKRSQESTSPQIQDESTEKRARIPLENFVVDDEEAASNTSNQNSQPIEDRIQEGSWPKEFFEPDPNMSLQLSRKHSCSSLSYTQSVKEGENPPAYTPEYENVLAKAGIFMHQSLGQNTVSDTCKGLCTALLSGEYELPEHSLFHGDSFGITLEKVRSKNEPRVVRDITPSVIPSAELLDTRGVQGLQYLTEEISAEWTKCICLAGPRPKPDHAVGLTPSAFTDDEVQRLKCYTSPAKATLFTGNFYFPFLMCEVKCGENGLNIADRQNAHSTSIAVNAIVQLYRKASEGKELHRENQKVARLMDLHRKILVFSISHDHTMVRIYGHYPLIKGDETTFHRHLIREFSFRDQDGKEKGTAYSFTRKIYDAFGPTHLDRIRNAIVRLPDPEFESFASIASTENESDLPDSQELATSAPSSQGTGKFKRPKLPPKVMLQKEIDRQRDYINLLLKQQPLLIASSGNESLLQQENERQRQQLNREREESKQRHTELMDLLKEQKERQKEQEDRQTEQIDEQKEQVKKLTEMLKQQISGKRELSSAPSE